MRSLERFSERYQPTGGLAAEGVLNQLGRPSTEPIEVLVREAVQNCWDARRADAATVTVEIGHRVLDEDEALHLRERVLPAPPASLPLAGELGPGVDLLYFADFGTSGLGGPTRADTETTGTTDFVDFVRNVGQPPDKALGGGSFGYGKAAFYLASRASTIIVDTLCAPENERRVIAYGLGDHHDHDGILYTGRHWWGVEIDGVPEPLTGVDAATLAAALGLPRRGDSDHGTTVAIVAPRLAIATGEEDDDGVADRDALAFIGECLAWNFWPKMIAPPGGTPAMAFRLVAGDDGIDVPDPRTHDRLAPFTRAMDVLRSDESDPLDPFSTRDDLHCHKPRRKVGILAVQRTPTAATEAPDGALTAGARDTAGGLQHVALMRNAELVVNYLRGPTPAVPGQGYAGVFRCDLTLDEVFRRSEPPTHDSWEPATLTERNEKTFVNMALKRIRERINDLVAPHLEPSDGDVTGISVGRFADVLAGLMPDLHGPGARRTAVGGTAPGGGVGGAGSAGGGGGAPGRSGPRVTGVGTPELVTSHGIPVIRTPFELATGDRPARLQARIEVLTMDGGHVETDPPADSPVPRALRWTTPQGDDHEGPEVTAEAGESGGWTIWVAHHPDVMMRIGVETASG